jgi:hypothetical protein
MLNDMEPVFVKANDANEPVMPVIAVRLMPRKTRPVPLAGTDPVDQLPPVVHAALAPPPVHVTSVWPEADAGTSNQATNKAAASRGQTPK